MILQNSGDFIIHTNQYDLLKHLMMVEYAGEVCYRSGKDDITEETAAAFARRLIKNGHTSVLEHTLLVVEFFNVSRGFTHEIVRHRHTGFSQESTRYVDQSNFNFVMPSHKNEHEQIYIGENYDTFSPIEMIKTYKLFYQGLREAGWSPQDARQFLPIGITSRIVVSASFREWRSIFELRCAKTAHWEIRSVMNKLLRVVKEEVPGIFDDFVYGGKDKNGLDYYIKENEGGK